MESGADSTTHCAQTEGEFKKKQQHNIIVVIIVFLWTEQSSVCFFSLRLCSEGVSQFGLLELSESQGLNIEAQNIESGDEDVEVTPANLRPADSPKTTNQSKSKSPVHSLAPLYPLTLLRFTTSFFCVLQLD